MPVEESLFHSTKIVNIKVKVCSFTKCNFRKLNLLFQTTNHILYMCGDIFPQKLLSKFLKKHGIFRVANIGTLYILKKSDFMNFGKSSRKNIKINKVYRYQFELINSNFEVMLCNTATLTIKQDKCYCLAIKDVVLSKRSL